ncbi:MAG: hypothetical protein AAGJ40_10075 [Planctomycetota bacterium]
MRQSIIPAVGIAMVAWAAAGCSKSPANSTSDTASASPATSEPEPVAKAPEPVLELPAIPAGESDDGALTISQVMLVAHDSKIYRRLMKEGPRDEDVQFMQTVYKDLPSRESPKGDNEDWVQRSQALVDAVDMIAMDDPSGISAFKRAVNCNSCHSRHRL